MPSTSPDSELGLLLLAAQADTDGGVRRRLAAGLAAPFDGERLYALSREQEIHPLLWRALRKAAPGLDAPWVSALERDCLNCFARNILLKSELVGVNGILSGAVIPVLALKGPVFAEQVYGGLERRTTGDLDLWVHKSDAARAVDILVASGYRLCFPLPAVPVHEFLAFENALTLVREDGHVPVFVDLHWDIARPEHMVGTDLAGVWQRALGQPGRDGAPPMPAPEDHLLFLAMHGYRHLWDRLKLLCDIDALIRSSGTGVDWEVLAERARAWRIDDIVERALRLSAALLETPLPPGASACLAGRYWLTDPLTDPAAFRDSSLRNREVMSTAGAWMTRLASRKGVIHRTRHVLGSFRPNSMEFIALRGAGKYAWMPWALRPLRLARKVTGQALSGRKHRGQ